MRLTVQFKLLPTSEQQGKYSSKNIVAELPSALRGQIAEDAKSIFKKYTKNLKENAKKESEKQKEFAYMVVLSVS